MSSNSSFAAKRARNVASRRGPESGERQRQVLFPLVGIDYALLPAFARSSIHAERLTGTSSSDGRQSSISQPDPW